jgi:hypothetical protein
MILYIVREILEKDELAPTILKRPEAFVRAEGDRARFKHAVGVIVGDIVRDLNAELKSVGDDFDYRDKLRSDAWVKDMMKEVTKTHMKLVDRGSIKSFKDEWESAP